MPRSPAAVPRSPAAVPSASAAGAIGVGGCSGGRGGGNWDDPPFVGNSPPRVPVCLAHDFSSDLRRPFEAMLAAEDCMDTHALLPDMDESRWPEAA